MYICNSNYLPRNFLLPIRAWLAFVFAAHFLWYIIHFDFYSLYNTNDANDAESLVIMAVAHVFCRCA